MTNTLLSVVDIFAHRGSFNSHENSILGIKKCVANNINFEIDLRLKNRVYLSHDPKGYGEDFEEVCKILEKNGTKAALHIKEISVLSHVEKLIEKYAIQEKCFLFMDDLHHNELRNKLITNIEVAAYVPSLPSNVDSRILWCDESKEKWFEPEIVKKLHKNNKYLIAMSAELLKPKKKSELSYHWKEIISCGFDGICTDFPEYLLEFVKNGVKK